MIRPAPASLLRGQAPTSSSAGTMLPKRTLLHPERMPLRTGKRISPLGALPTDFAIIEQAAVTSSPPWN
jgi:hypothetical protein